MDQRITIDALIGQWIFFRLKGLPKELTGATTGVHYPDEWIKAKLRGVDNIGIWLENPHFKITYFIDHDGKPISAEKQVETTETALVLIRWEFIVSIIATDQPDKAKRSMNFAALGQESK